MRSRKAPPARFPFVRLALAAALLAAADPKTASAAKTDLVILRNGDRITGEVKELSYGKLDYSTDDAGRLSIEWEKVVRVTSPNVYEVEVASGVRFVGPLGATDTDAFLVVRGARPDTLRITDVTRITPLSAAFLERLKAYLDVGFTLAKANQATTFSLDGQIEYRGPKVGNTFSFDSYAQGQESTPTTSRGTVADAVAWYLPARWSGVALASVERNDELDLDYRFTGGGGVGRVLAQSNRMEVSAGAGFVVTQEQFTAAGSPGTSATNFEGLLTSKWTSFRFDSPTLDFSTALTLYPSISQAGRVRGQFDLRLKYELFKDFNAGIRFTDTFDSEPPEEGISKNDYVTTLTIGWSYRR